MCENFVASMYGAVGLGGYSSAVDQWQNIPGGLRHDGTDAPAGALVFWGGGYGHVAIAAGGGYVYTTDFSGSGKVTLVKASDITSQWGKPVLGWSQPYWGGHTVTLKGGAGDGPGMDGSRGGGGMGKQDKLSPQEMAEQYGWAMDFLKSVPELWDLFQKAVNQGWSSPEFQAKLRDTKWYQHNSETVRKNLLLQKTDPATWRDRVQETRASLRDMAGQMGADLSDHQLDRVAENALMFGWSDAQIQNTLSDYVDRIKGSFVGEAGANEDELIRYAKSMGVKVNPAYVRKAVGYMASGNWDMNRAKDHLQRLAMTQFPNLADDIKAGASVYDLASPFINSMSQILEINPEDIDLFDPKIRRALSARGKDGGKPEMKTLWEFEENLRKDPRWQATNNGREAITSGFKQVLSDFGFQAS
jgi:hypothetical protein